jgi:hypothetical protein
MFLCAVCVSQPLVETAFFHREAYGCNPLNISTSGDFVYLSGVFGRYADEHYIDSAYGGYVAQYTKQGELQWSRRFYSDSGSIRVIPLRSAADADGNVYTGHKRLSKFNSSGDMLFDFPLEPATTITNILVDHHNNIILFGSCGQLRFMGHELKQDGFIAKLSPVGEIIWLKDFFADGSTIGSGLDVTLDDQDDIYVTGSFNHDQYFLDEVYLSGDLCDGFVGKISSKGELQWVKLISGSSTQSPSFVHVNSLGHIYVAGDFQREIKFSNSVHLPVGATEFDLFIARLDQSGNCLWAKRGQSSGGEEVYDLESDGKGTVYMAGTSRSKDGLTFGEHTVYGLGNYTNNSFLAEVDSSGNILGLWNGTNASAYNYLNCLATDEEGAIFAAGSCGEGGFTLLGEKIVAEKPLVYVLKLHPTLRTSTSENTQPFASHKVKVCPNPAKNEINLLPGYSCGHFECTIIDVHGRILVHRQGQFHNNPEHIQLPDFSAGSYIIEIKTEEGIESHKLLVQ